MNMSVAFIVLCKGSFITLHFCNRLAIVTEVARVFMFVENVDKEGMSNYFSSILDHSDSASNMDGSSVKIVAIVVLITFPLNSKT